MAPAIALAQMMPRTADQSSDQLRPDYDPLTRSLDNERDSESATLFSGSCVPDIQQGVAEISRQIFGFELSEVEFARLAGAPNGSLVKVTGRLTQEERVVCVEVRNDLFEAPMLREIHATADTEPFDGGHQVWIRNRRLMLAKHARGRGLGARVFGWQVIAALECGVDRFLTLAARSEEPIKMIGYRFWPQLGFDGVLPPSVSAKLRDDLRGASRLSELLSSKDGWDWWYEFGSSIELEFDLRQNDPYLQVLSSELFARGIRL